MRDNTHSILHSASRFFSGTMLSRISGLLRDIAMAYAFGTQSAIAALLVAFRFAHLLRRLLGEGALQTAFIPHFENLRKNDPVRAAGFFLDLNLSMTYLLIALISVVSAALWSFYQWWELSPGNAEIVWFTLLMMPSLLFICLFGINASLLQCEKSFFVPSAAPIAFNLVWIAGIFCVYHLPVTQAMSWLAGFIVLACFCQWATTVPKTRKIIREHLENSSTWASKAFSKDVLKLTSPLALGVIGVAAAQINSALDALFARWADPQGPALLWYAIRLQQLPLALFGIAIAGALLPPLSRAIRAGDKGNYHLFLDFAIQRSLALMVPITIALFVLGDLCVNLIYGRGDFTGASVVGTTQALWGYSLGLVPMTLVLVLAPAFYAKGDYRTPSLASAGSVGINCVLNVLFVGGFGLGAASVALATGISAWFNLFWLMRALQKEEGVAIAYRPFKLVSISVAAGGITLGVALWLFGKLYVVEIIRGIIPEYSHGFMAQVGYLVELSLVFACSFAVLAVVGKVEDVLMFFKNKENFTNSCP